MTSSLCKESGIGLGGSDQTYILVMGWSTWNITGNCIAHVNQLSSELFDCDCVRCFLRVDACVIMQADSTVPAFK